MTTAVLCAVRGPAETAVVRGLDGSAELVVSRRCADLAELLAAGAAGLGVVAVVSADLPGMDREAVHHLHGSGVWVLALSDPRAGWPPDRLQRLGVDAVVPADEAVTSVAPAVDRLLDRAGKGDRPGGASSSAGARTAGRTSGPARFEAPARPGPAAAPGP
ncbi:MAG TPA: hypothetical protein VN257_10860, partial [Actinotalea sp.]|nr:hypothetical protein [Actinotalea sp.]